MRCGWANVSTLARDYHDYEWGKVVHTEKLLFEFLVLESMQAGLSWSTILKKRTGLREAFDDFDYQKIAIYDEEKYQELLRNPQIIRHPLKIKAVIHNAQTFIRIQEQFGSFDRYFWDFNHQETIVNEWETLEQIPTQTILSQQIAKKMKKDGFKFIGATSIYSFMQAIGMVDDHLTCCAFKERKEAN